MNIKRLLENPVFTEASELQLPSKEETTAKPDVIEIPYGLETIVQGALEAEHQRRVLVVGATHGGMTDMQRDKCRLLARQYSEETWDFFNSVGKGTPTYRKACGVFFGILEQFGDEKYDEAGNRIPLWEKTDIDVTQAIIDAKVKPVF
jgi:hypothetical protein